MRQSITSPTARAAVQEAEPVDCIVVGAGVVGLAVARALALAGREVLLIESEGGIGTGVSSRNSEVIHAGIYYTPGSLKARHCVRGNALLYAYCRQRHIDHQACGKLIVATSQAQVAKLQAIAANARANGVTDLILLSQAQAIALEPALRCEAALLSPRSGIVDSHALMLALQGDLENAGGTLVFNTPVEQVQLMPRGGLVSTGGRTPMTLQARLLVNCAGLHAQALARRMTGFDTGHIPACHYAKGNYFSISGRAPFSRLIYPVPEAAGLGVHLTIDLGQQARFGPDVEWVSALDYQVDAARSAAFYQEIRHYWPALPDGALQPAYAGIRPKIQGPGEPAVDFQILGPDEHGAAGVIQLFGIESPGLTASLSIAEQVCEMAAATDPACRTR
ncbi:NAD(P)/FAD-dependent oxidoreductase [Polaromonas sp.]|uniref:NAD(P)/FAD-dependent oxidoreductase n=1 Tax=Polaromonas sp. TaxID=1869339 RepID=UPI00272EF1CE|nr:NAD(P)/FAD-dependent oxidoreductase [Polaromonas sp.]MDP1888918.1 NAD(P)/FAD-dependent oxidoreductase [Polaromonas sp.]